jgi:hypothetical protein
MTLAIGSPASAIRRPVAPATSVTYASVTGVVPLSQACGSRDPVAALAGMYDETLLGVHLVRCDLNWWTVQPTNATTYDWTTYDNAVNAASHFGLQLLFTVAYTPPWARPNPLPPGTLDPSHVPPVHLNDYITFVKAAVSRYSPRGRTRVPSVVGTVEDWEIWNEPNITGGWTPANPVTYGNFLKVVASRIHEMDRRAIVISGGMAPAITKGGNYSPADFVTGMAPTGVLPKVDAIGMHPYMFPAYPDEQITFNPLYKMVPDLYQVMTANGIGAKKIWATEVGWPTSSQSNQTLRPWDHIQVGTEAYQAKELPVLLVTWFKLAYAGPLVMYEEQDSCTDNRSWFCKMGLERTDGSKKPAWTTVQNQLAQSFMA